MVTFSINDSTDDMFLTSMLYLQSVIKAVIDAKVRDVYYDNMHYLTDMEADLSSFIKISNQDVLIFKETGEVNLPRALAFIKSCMKNNRLDGLKSIVESIDSYDEHKVGTFAKTSDDVVFEEYIDSESYREELLENFRTVRSFLLYVEGVDILTIFKVFLVGTRTSPIQEPDSYHGKRLGKRLRDIINSEDLNHKFYLQYGESLSDIFLDIVEDIEVILPTITLESEETMLW